METATGFDFEPLPDGNVLIEFFGDDGKTFNKQVVTPDFLHDMPLVASLTVVAMRHGPQVAREIMRKLGASGMERGVVQPAELPEQQDKSVHWATVAGADQVVTLEDRGVVIGILAMSGPDVVGGYRYFRVLSTDRFHVGPIDYQGDVQGLRAWVRQTYPAAEVLWACRELADREQ